MQKNLDKATIPPEYPPKSNSGHAAHPCCQHPKGATIPVWDESHWGGYNRAENMAESEDYYKTLGLKRDASQAEIQKAYRDLAKKYHPDRNPGDKQAAKKFQAVQAAFEVLNDPEKREMYDRYGSSFGAHGPGGPQGARTYAGGPGGGFGGFNVEDIDLSQLFGDRFGGGGGGGFEDLLRQFNRGARRRGRGGGSTRQRGGDLQHELHVPFTSAVVGGSAEISVQRGSGQVETLAVKIPAGIEDGKKIRLRGQGEPGPEGGPAGDILLTVRVDPHPHFERRGNNLLVRVPVTLTEAALGAKIDVPSPNGTVSVRVPPGSSSGAKLRVKGLGCAPQGQPAGDLLVEVQIVLPKSLDESAREAISKLNLKYPSDPRAKLRW